jgi:hypothetical protein
MNVKVKAEKIVKPKIVKARKAPAIKPLENGQFWRVGEGHIHIVQVGKFLAQFKHFKLKNQKRVPVQMMNIASVQDYLKRNDAKLVKAIVE